MCRPACRDMNPGGTWRWPKFRRSKACARREHAMKMRVSANGISSKEKNKMERLQNFVDGGWRASSANDALKVIDPASAKVLAEVPLSPATDVNAAVEAAERAFIEWRRTPVVDRIQPLFRLKTLLEQHREELGLSITHEWGKALTGGQAG